MNSDPIFRINELLALLHGKIYPTTQVVDGSLTAENFIKNISKSFMNELFGLRISPSAITEFAELGMLLWHVGDRETVPADTFPPFAGRGGSPIPATVTGPANQTNVYTSGTPTPEMHPDPGAGPEQPYYDCRICLRMDCEHVGNDKHGIGICIPFIDPNKPMDLPEAVKLMTAHMTELATDKDELKALCVELLAAGNKIMKELYVVQPLYGIVLRNLKLIEKHELTKELE